MHAFVFNSLGLGDFELLLQASHLLPGVICILLELWITTSLVFTLPLQAFQTVQTSPYCTIKRGGRLRRPIGKGWNNAQSSSDTSVLVAFA
mmetsp:Transcript_35333/g.77186  ORF Transcript_35333/g.77186 Transcript_35333/m.77186 type:complete len:91 (+) Transcript_35333:178-450(+)